MINILYLVHKYFSKIMKTITKILNLNDWNNKLANLNYFIHNFIFSPLPSLLLNYAVFSSHLINNIFKIKDYLLLYYPKIH
jgi:hypothetical protein